MGQGVQCLNLKVREMKESEAISDSYDWESRRNDRLGAETRSDYEKGSATQLRERSLPAKKEPQD